MIRNPYFFSTVLIAVLAHFASSPAAAQREQLNKPNFKQLDQTGSDGLSLLGLPQTDTEAVVPQQIPDAIHETQELFPPGPLPHELNRLRDHKFHKFHQQHGYHGHHNNRIQPGLATLTVIVPPHSHVVINHQRTGQCQEHRVYRLTCPDPKELYEFLVEVKLGNRTYFNKFATKHGCSIGLDWNRGDFQRQKNPKTQGDDVSTAIHSFKWQIFQINEKLKKSEKEIKRLNRQISQRGRATNAPHSNLPPQAPMWKTSAQNRFSRLATRLTLLRDNVSEKSDEAQQLLAANRSELAALYGEIGRLERDIANTEKEVDSAANDVSTKTTAANDALDEANAARQTREGAEADNASVGEITALRNVEAQKDAVVTQTQNELRGAVEEHRNRMQTLRDLESRMRQQQDRLDQVEIDIEDRNEELQHFAVVRSKIRSADNAIRPAKSLLDNDGNSRRVIDDAIEEADMAVFEAEEFFR